MDRDQLIERFNDLYPDQDPAAVYDWASEATEDNTVLVPFSYVYDMCHSFACSLGLENPFNSAKEG